MQVTVLQQPLPPAYMLHMLPAHAGLIPMKLTSLPAPLLPALLAYSSQVPQIVGTPPPLRAPDWTPLQVTEERSH